MNPSYRIVLTGGPCAGKTSALLALQSHFQSQGFAVFIIPEMPTLFSQSGVDFLTENKTLFRQAEKSLIALQMSIEDEFEKIARATNRPSLVLCDRGVLDISAYLPEELWSQLLQENNIHSPLQLLERYQLVIHLTSTACGAAQFYGKTTNEHRSENVELAQKLDARLQAIWSIHPFHHIIGNAPTFEQKRDQIITTIHNFIQQEK